MDCERSNITILVVDHDEECLAFVANTLMERQYKVETAKNAHDALVTLRKNEGLFDIIITEFHVLGMDGFGFQKHIQDQFQIPVIMMSKDNRQHIISKTLENGATHFIVKPVCAEDFKDISNYVVEAKKHKLFIDNLFVQSEEQESSEKAKTKKKDSKRKSIDESQGKAKCKLVKKSSRLVWTNDLHNLFLDAIKKLGLKKAVPGKILEFMNIPNLTRDNVASHLQKYRSFLEKAAKKDMAGDHRALRSKFAYNIPTSMIEEIQQMRTNIFDVPTLYQYGERNNVLNSFNNNDFSYIQNGLTYGSRQGSMAVSCGSNFLTRDFKLGETSSPNSSIGNGYFNQMNHGVTNWNCGYLNNDASAFLKYDLINSIQDVQSLDQLYKGSDDTSLVGNTSCVLNESPLSVNQNSMQLYQGGDHVISSPSAEINSYMLNESPISLDQNSNLLYQGGDHVISSPSAEINSCMLNESPISLDQNFNQLQGNEQFSNEELYDMFMGDKMSEASTSATNPKSDMDLFEAVFGTTSQNNNFKFI